MDDDQQFCLRWNNHQSTLISVFDTLLENGTLVDCTLAAEGKFLKAHKVVLSACSPYFATLLSQQYDKHPIFILKDVKFQELRAMMDYMYRGEVNISQDQLAALLKAAESLQIKGLSDSRGGSGSQKPTNEHKQLSVPANVTGKCGSSSGGYTLEQKRPRHTLDTQELSGSREGSSSPTSRKRKKIRRRSVDNVLADNHEHSNSSSHSMQVVNSSVVPPSNTSAAIASVSTTAATSSLSTSSTVATVSAAAAAGINVTKKTEIISNTKIGSMEQENDDDNGDDEDMQDENDKTIGQVKKEQVKQRKIHIDSETGKESSEMLIEPKSEYDDGNDETVEDLTLDDEELLEDLDQAGPSHGGGEGSSQGYAQWQVDRSQDEVFMAAQEAAGQQRDPQDLSTKAKVTTTPERPSTSSSTYVDNSSTTKVKAILAMMNPLSLTNSDVSDRLFEFYKENHSDRPKTKIEKIVAARVAANSPPAQPQQQHQSSIYNVDASTLSIKPAAKNDSIEMSPPVVKTNGITGSNGPNGPISSTSTVTASKNVNGDEMVGRDVSIVPSGTIKRTSAPFHPRIKYSNVNNKPVISTSISASPTIPPNVPLPSVVPAPVIQPPILPPSPAAAAIAAAIGYHNFQQMRAQELLKHQHHPQSTAPIPPLPAKPQFYMQSLMRKDQQPPSENDESSSEEEDDEDDEGGNKYPGIDDIQLIEGSKSGFSNQMSLSMDGDYSADETHKYSVMAAQALRFELSASFGEYGSGSSAGEEPLYQCRHCGKRYRWKSTLRRHESVECGGKEPSHQCPYCPYKSKQRGNLGVHVRKHHANLPQLASKRRSKYSQPREHLIEPHRN